MNFLKKINPVAFLVLFLFSACSKNGGVNPGGGGGGGHNYGNGAIYYDWSTDGIQKITLQSGAKATEMPEDVNRHAWDISLDGKTILVNTNAPGTDYDANLYTISNIATGTIVSQFKYYPTQGDYTSPYLSPDGSMIAVDPTFEDGIVILDLQGNILHNLATFQGQKISGHLVWMPDNSLLFSIGKNIYRTNQAFTSATLIKQVNFNSWGSLTASRDGSKIALKGGNHIWMMNADGSSLVQVTQSSQVEAAPVFSPDGKYLLVGTNYRESLAASSLWNLAIIPADGQQYNVDDGADKRVIPVIAKGGGTTVEASDGNMEWR